jgi:aspartate kinase
MIVMKFGGTSTKDASAVANVVRIVGSHAARKPFVVISAIAQGTNALEQAGRLASENKTGEARDRLLQLFNRHYTMVDELVKDRDRHRELRKVFAKSLAELEELLTGISILRELTPRTLDTIYSFGELLSSRIVAAALQEAGIRSEWLDTADFLVTDDSFNAARPMMNVVSEKLQALAGPATAAGAVPVTQGFIGVTAAGRRTTMGRESSDYSAAIVGAALGADEIQIWTDVDGVLTADPRTVNSPKKVKLLSFDEAYQLSFFGAKVLHPKTMLPAIEKGIPIHIYNSYRPDNTGTRVMSTSGDDEPMVKSVAHRNNLVLLSLQPRHRYGQFMFWEHISGVLTKYGAIPAATATTEYSYALVCDAKSDFTGILSDLEEVAVASRFDGQGIICLVGSNLRQSPSLCGRVFAALGNVPVSMISFGASGSNMTIVLGDDSVSDAVRRIHAAFFESSPDGTVFETLKGPALQKFTV